MFLDKTEGVLAGFTLARFALGQFNRIDMRVLVGDLRQQVGNDVQANALLLLRTGDNHGAQAVSVAANIASLAAV